MAEDLVLGTSIPQNFLTWYGYASVRHAGMDQAVNSTITLLAQLDRNSSVGILSAVVTFPTRLEMMRHLILTNVTNTDHQDMLLIIQKRAVDLHGRVSNPAPEPLWSFRLSLVDGSEYVRACAVH